MLSPPDEMFNGISFVFMFRVKFLRGRICLPSIQGRYHLRSTLDLIDWLPLQA